MKVKEESEKFSLKLSIKKTKIWLKTQHSKNRSWHLSHHIMANRWGNSGNILLSLAPKSLQMVTAAMKLKDAYSLEEKL